MQTQQTIGQSVSLAGVGLHSGSPSRLTLSPGPPDNGGVAIATDKWVAIIATN